MIYEYEVDWSSDGSRAHNPRAEKVERASARRAHTRPLSHEPVRRLRNLMCMRPVPLSIPTGCNPPFTDSHSKPNGDRSSPDHAATTRTRPSCLAFKSDARRVAGQSSATLDDSQRAARSQSADRKLEPRRAALPAVALPAAST